MEAVISMRKAIIMKIIFIIAGLFLIYQLIINFMIDQDYLKLRKLNFQPETIEKIKAYNIINEVLEKNKYSKTLEESLLTNQFHKPNFDLYYEIPFVDNAAFIPNINKLVTRGYNKTQIILIFKYLNNKEITRLLNHNLISDIEKYIVFDYFLVGNLERYLNYQKKTNHSYHQVITQVNIGLDNPFYTNIKEIKDPHRLTVLVNKYHHLPNTFIPDDLSPVNDNLVVKTIQLRTEVKKAFEKMGNEAQTNGLNLKGTSGFRSYDEQKQLYNYYVSQDGKELADHYSARAGHSEHQTGLAIDVVGPDEQLDNFEKTEEFKWLLKHHHEYGFIIRYPKDKEYITGYQYEPWHLRYVGVSIASYIKENNLTFDEYYIQKLDKK